MPSRNTPSRNTQQRLARALQRCAGDELGRKVKLTRCHNIVRDHGASTSGSIEERAAALFLAHRAHLEAP